MFEQKFYGAAINSQCQDNSSGTGYSWTTWAGTTYSPYPYWKIDPAPQPPQDIDVLRALEEATEAYEKFAKENKKNKEVDIMFLYRVYLIYAADRKNPQVITTGSTIAKDDEDAKVKSGVYQKIDAEWDADYITVVCEKVAEVKVKPKPQETVIVSQAKPV